MRRTHRSNQTHLADFLEQLWAGLWNRLVIKRQKKFDGTGLALGLLVANGQITRKHFFISQKARAEHLAILGRTGTGKSSLLKDLAGQDIRSARGFIYFDLHGDTTDYLLEQIALEERSKRADLSGKVIIIEPADPDHSVGLNVLENRAGQSSFVQIAEFAGLLKRRFGLEHLGARTEELLRNALLVLAENNLTLLELSLLLTNSVFRAQCCQQVQIPDVRVYFEERYGRTSEALQAVFRDPILNKVSAFTADPRFRHILGQQQSTFSLQDALDQGQWIILKLDKGRLGEQALTLGALFLSKIKNALFARRSGRLFTIYADEVQNLIAFDSGLETLLSEARKFAVSVTTANQFLDQYPPEMRSAILSVNTHVLFRLSSADAEKMAGALDGGKALAEILKNLPQRQMVIKAGHNRAVQAVVSEVKTIRTRWRDLYERSRARWARRRTEIEAEIQNRRAVAEKGAGDELKDWE